MILILTYAEKLQEFLENKTKTGIIQKFKIFMRIGFQLDAYVFATNCQLLQNIETEFYDFLAEKDVYLTNPQKTKIYFNILPLSELNDSYYSNIVNDPNTIDLGPRYRFDSILEDNHEKKDDSLPPVITFYSYKGGVGRTTCMVAYAIHLAKMGKSVAVIDCDLEAPGYLNFFKLSENKKLAEGKKNGVVEFICDTQFTGTDVDINNYIINIGAGNSTLGQNHPELNKIWLVPAGNLNESYEDFAFSENREHYLEGLSKINLGNTQTIIDGFNQLFHHLQKNVACDVILIDSRTGFNDIFGTAVLRLSSCVIGFFGFSQQTVPGFIHLLNEHSKDENRFSLFLAYSILSEGKGENDIPKEMQAFIHRVYDEKSIIPHFFIHRNSVLESIGTGNHTADESFISEESLEYKKLFEELDDKNFPQKAVTIAINTFDVNTENKAKDISSNTRPLILRNIILQHLYLKLQKLFY